MPRVRQPLAREDCARHHPLCGGRGVQARGQDRGLLRSLRHVNGYGRHTYSLINAQNERFWVKFHFKTLQGIQCLTNEEAAAVVAKDRESSQRNRFEAIERGEFPQ